MGAIVFADCSAAPPYGRITAHAAGADDAVDANNVAPGEGQSSTILSPPLSLGSVPFAGKYWLGQ
jgi:hypothetical protein